MRLHVGCSDDLKDGWMNVDVFPPEEIARIAVGVPARNLAKVQYQQTDLNFPWPWADSSADAILANDVFEHILDCQHVPDMACAWCKSWNPSEPIRSFYGQIHCLNEAWRVLKPGGVLDFKVPSFCLADGKSFNPGAVCDPTHRTFWHEDFRYYFCEEWNHPRGERGRLGPGMGIVALFRPHTVRTIDYGEGREKRSKLVAVLEAIK